MSNWISITINTLYEAKVAVLVDACSTAAKKAAQPDRAPGIIQGVVWEARNAVATCSSNRVDSDETTIPRSLRRHVVTLILAELKAVIDEPLTDDETKAVALANSKLKDVARCELRVEMPDSPVAAPTESGSEIETIVAGDQGNSREDLKGL